MLDTVSRVSDEAKVEALEPEQPRPDAAEAHESEPAATHDAAEWLSPELLAAARKVVPALWIAAAVLAGFSSGPPLLLLILAAGALALVLILMWSSVQSLTGGAALGFEEALGMGAPSRVEEEKRAVLRALKDLEYERGVGKISPEDYAELSARYRAEAKRLMQSLDEALGPAREAVERDIARRLAKAGVSPPDAAQAAPASEKTAEEPAETAPSTPEKSS